MKLFLFLPIMTLGSIQRWDFASVSSAGLLAVRTKSTFWIMAITKEAAARKSTLLLKSIWVSRLAISSRLREEEMGNP
jgi:hypothetical protein